MLISCKITASVIAFLENKGEDISVLLEGTSLPEEFLQDPSYWLQADAMEKFLSAVLEMQPSPNPESLVAIAHSIPRLRSWGVFDSVLRMMPLSDVFAQPKRFISYFVSPEIEVTQVERKLHSISFHVPVDWTSYPLTRLFLKAAFETLPLFSALPLGVCVWTGERVEINWDSAQENLFVAQDPGRSLSPELLRSIVSQLEQHQLELQQKNADLEARNQQLREAFQQLQNEVRTQSSSAKLALDSSQSLVLKKNLARLGDYMVRAQQLITILAGGKSQAPVVKEALRRTDWSWVKDNYQLTVMDCFEILQKSEMKTPNAENPSEPGVHHV